MDGKAGSKADDTIVDNNYQLDDEDIRSILLAERVEAIFRDIHDNKPLRGKEDEFYTYKRMGPLRTSALIILLF